MYISGRWYRSSPWILKKRKVIDTNCRSIIKNWNSMDGRNNCSLFRINVKKSTWKSNSLSLKNYRVTLKQVGATTTTPMHSWKGSRYATIELVERYEIFLRHLFFFFFLFSIETEIQLDPDSKLTPHTRFDVLRAYVHRTVSTPVLRRFRCFSRQNGNISRTLLPSTRTQ